MVRSMADDAIVFAMANPVPEIMPELAKNAGARVVGTGRSDFPNQVNDVLAFPGIFRGALDVRASDINDEMKMAASYAIASLVSEKELNAEYILPMAFDERIGKTVAKAVAEAARNGDECALEVYRLCGEYLGRGLSVVIDILNPERIVIGSIFTRSRDLLWEEADKVIKREVLAPSYNCCEVVGAELGEQIGDYGAITVALYGEGIF
jgi:hypothetical protein